MNNRIKLVKNFTIAIPTFNSSEYLEECILGFKKSKYLNEILVSDDCSNDEEKIKLKNTIKKLNKYFEFDIVLIENSKNIGAFKNKYNLISKSKNDWVYQIDSDNVPFPKIDNIMLKIIKNNGSKKHIYYPSKIIQFWRYKKLSKFFSIFNKKYVVKFSKNKKIFDIKLTKEAINEFLSYDSSGDTVGSPNINSKFLLDKHIFWVLNCGNFIVNKNQFLSAMQPGLEFSRELVSMDAVAFSYLWLKTNGKIILYPELHHYHRKRFDSVSYIEKEDSKKSRDFFTEKILKLSS